MSCSLVKRFLYCSSVGRSAFGQKNLEEIFNSTTTSWYIRFNCHLSYLVHPLGDLQCCVHSLTEFCNPWRPGNICEVHGGGRSCIPGEYGSHSDPIGRVWNEICLCVNICGGGYRLLLLMTNNLSIFASYVAAQYSFLIGWIIADNGKFIMGMGNLMSSQQK